jgi:fumarate reductase flavoprotein subunit
MVSPERFDAIVVGGGMAGLTAANRLAELGKRVVVVEKGTGAYFCNARISGGLFHICFRDIMTDPEELKTVIAATVPDRPSPDVGDAVAAGGARLIRWMQQAGIRFMKAGFEEWRSWALAPPGLMRTGLAWEGRGGDVMLRTLRSRFEGMGGRFREGATAAGLLLRGGKCHGLAIESGAEPKEIESGAVLLADGGFQGNSEMVARYITRHPERLRQRGAGTGHGDGIRMAEAAGARLAGMDRFYGHVLSRDAMTSDKLWPYPVIDMVTTAGIVVDEAARRFADEGRGGVYMANAISRLDDPLASVAIFDEAIWTGPGRQFILPCNPNLAGAGGTMHTANDLAALARKAGLPEAALAATVADYNTAVDAGATESLSPGRCAAKGAPMPIRTAPFHAIPLCAGITYTMGGIVTDASGHVLRADDTIIDGLYAAGATTGGLEGGAVAGYVGGLVKSGVGGLRAAEAIAAAG